MQHSSIFRSPAFQVALAGAGAVWLAKHALRRRRAFALAGRTVLITGGSRGLGLALAREFAGQRARIALCARDATGLQAAEQDLRPYGVDVQTFVCDLSGAKQASELIDRVESSFGEIDVLVNNAATILVGPVPSMTVEDFQEAMALNFWAAVHTTLAAAPKMKARGGGRIVNVGSIGGKVPVPHLAPYCASKFALAGFSATLRTEMAKDRVLITTVHPGLMRTGSPRNAGFKGRHRAEYGWFSVADDFPGLSMGAATAAKRIVAAAVHGDAEVLLGLPARLAAAFYGLAPDLHVELTALLDRALPSIGQGDPGTKRGRDSESWLTRSFLRFLGRRAERDLNQLQSVR